MKNKLSYKKKACSVFGMTGRARVPWFNSSTDTLFVQCTQLWLDTFYLKSFKKI